MISGSKVHPQLIVPIVLAGAAVVVTALVYRLYFSKKKGESGEKTKQNGDKQQQSTQRQSMDENTLLVDLQKKYAIPLIEREELSHDVRRFRFGLPTKDHKLGLPIGQHVHLSAKINGELVIRAYTPVSSAEELGYVDFVIKVYYKNVHFKFLEGGKMSQYLDALKIGQTIDVRGPSGRLIYNGHGEFNIKKMRKDPPVSIRVQRICMIAGGTGITPMLQLIRHITRDPSDRTQMALIFANQTVQDILLRKELDDYAQAFPKQFKVWYTVDTPPPNWQFSTGFVSEEMIMQHLYPSAPSTFVVMCGPPPMINYACIPNLEKLNYEKELCFTY